jgi:CIC family chloride channel protein
LSHPLFFILGAVAGFAAIFYNRLLLKTMDAVSGLTLASLKPGAAASAAAIGAIAWVDVPFGLGVAAVALVYHRIVTRMMEDGRTLAPVELRAWWIGAAVGTLGWSAPALVGGGDALTQKVLSGSEALAIIPLVFALRLVLGSVSYAAGTPGGLFAPLLVLGAQLGFLFGGLCQFAFPGLEVQPLAFAVVGMTAFFTGVVRAPLTGIVLVSEMTSSVAMLLPMLAACFAAMVVPTRLQNAPIYDSLRELTLRSREDSGGD